MTAEESLSHIQFHKAGNRTYQIEHGDSHYDRWVEARTVKPSGEVSKAPVGALSYFKEGFHHDGPEVYKVGVKPAHQRRGIASAMFDIADQHAQARYGKKLEHSHALTDDGKAFVAGLARKRAASS